MRARCRYLLLAVLMGPWHAATAGDTLRVDSHVLVVGDTATRVIELLGKPVYREPINNEYGAWLGERWQYSRDGHVITFTVLGGKVANIDDRRS